MGAIAGGGVALWFGDSNSYFAMPLMLLAGVLGGMLGLPFQPSCEPNSTPTKFS